MVPICCACQFGLARLFVESKDNQEQRQTIVDQPPVGHHTIPSLSTIQSSILPHYFLNINLLLGLHLLSQNTFRLVSQEVMHI